VHYEKYLKNPYMKLMRYSGSQEQLKDLKRLRMMPMNMPKTWISRLISQSGANIFCVLIKTMMINKFYKAGT